MIRWPLPLTQAIRRVGQLKDTGAIAYGWAMALLSLSETSWPEYELFRATEKAIEEAIA